MPAAFLASALIQFVLGLVVAWLIGPAEFGAYALALAAAVLVQTVSFEWLRLAATRFHHADMAGAFRGALLGRFAVFAAVLLAASLLLAFFGGQHGPLLSLVPLVAIAAGFADLRAALLRAEFETKIYALFLMLRNGLAMVLLPLSALSGRSDIVLGAFLLSILVASGVVEWRIRRRPTAMASVTDAAPNVMAMARYAFPIVGTNLLYLGLFFLVRAGIAYGGGIAASGQASLALDFTLKLFTTAGTAFDLLFFQLAVRDEREQGRDAGDARIAMNFERLLVLLSPMALGLAFVIARVEPWLVAPEYRGAFALFVLASLPGVFTYALVQYGLHPVFQLRTDTARLLKAALVAGLAGSAVLIASLGLGAPKPVLLGGPVLAAMLGAAIMLLLDGKPILPSRTFWFRLFASLAPMSVCLWALGSLGDGLATLIAMVAVGAASYALAAWIFNPGDIRALGRGAA